MKKWIAGLGALLIIQIVLAITLNRVGDTYTAFTPEDKLANFEPAQIDTVVIETADGQAVLKKVDGKWQLPGLDDFPADQLKVTQLLDNLSNLKKGWPVATTAGAAKRFKVDEEEFERRIILERGGNSVAKLYFGTSPGLRKVYARIADENEIITVGFSLFEAGSDNNDWIDSNILKLDEKKIIRVKFPGFTLQRRDETWQLEELAADEETVTGQTKNLIKKLAGLTIESLLTTEDNPELEKDTKPLTITVTLAGENSLDYTFSRLKDGGYLLQRSDKKTRFKVANWEVDSIKDGKRENLVEKKTSIKESDSERIGDE